MMPIILISILLVFISNTLQTQPEVLEHASPGYLDPMSLFTTTLFDSQIPKSSRNHAFSPYLIKSILAFALNSSLGDSKPNPNRDGSKIYYPDTSFNRVLLDMELVKILSISPRFPSCISANYVSLLKDHQGIRVYGSDCMRYANILTRGCTEDSVARSLFIAPPFVDELETLDEDANDTIANNYYNTSQSHSIYTYDTIQYYNDSHNIMKDPLQFCLSYLPILNGSKTAHNLTLLTGLSLDFVLQAAGLNERVNLDFFNFHPTYQTNSGSNNTNDIRNRSFSLRSSNDINLNRRRILARGSYHQTYGLRVFELFPIHKMMTPKPNNISSEKTKKRVRRSAATVSNASVNSLFSVINNYIYNIINATSNQSDLTQNRSQFERAWIREYSKKITLNSVPEFVETPVDTHLWNLYQKQQQTLAYDATLSGMDEEERNEVRILEIKSVSGFINSHAEEYATQLRNFERYGSHLSIILLQSDWGVNLDDFERLIHNDYTILERILNRHNIFNNRLNKGGKKLMNICLPNLDIEYTMNVTDIVRNAFAIKNLPMDDNENATLTNLYMQTDFKLSDSPSVKTSSRRPWNRALKKALDKVQLQNDHFVANRPFIYMVIYRPTGDVLLYGKFKNPIL